VGRAALIGVAFAMALPGPLGAVRGDKDPFATQGIVTAVRMKIGIEIHLVDVRLAGRGRIRQG
jgi:hypothetical protein